MESSSSSKGMDLLEKFSGVMKHIESKRASAEKAMHSLLVEWKNLEHADSSAQQLLQDCCIDIQSKQEQFNKVKESVMNRNRELEEMAKKLEERLEEAESREKDLRVKHAKMSEHLELKMKNVEEKEKEVELKVESNKKCEDDLDGFFVDIDLSTKNVREKEKEVELKLKSIEIREFELEKAWAELDMKMKNLKEKEKEVEVKKKSLRNEEKKLDWKKKSIIKRENRLDWDLDEFHVKMKNVTRKEKELALKEKSFQNREKELALKEKRFENHNMELEWALVEFDLTKNNVEKKEEELRMMENSINNRKIELQSKENEVKLIQITCEERCRNLDLEKKKLENQEVKNKQYSNVDQLVVKPEPWTDDGSYEDIRFNITMNGKNLLLYLINHKMNFESRTDEVYNALRLSKDPARIVLNAMQDFYAIKEDKEFEEDVVCRSSILLLEQLRKISSHIQSYNKRAALELARKWKANMKSSMEVTVFLQLLASYKLGSSFEPEEFLSLIEVIDQPTQISELFQLLGYMGKISDLIISLIQKGDRLQAIRYIYEFKLEEKFPPVPILKDHISFNNVLAEEIHGKKASDEPEGNAINKQLVSLRAVVKCIKDHQLEVEYPPESLLAQVQQLEEKFKKNTKRADLPKKLGKKRHAAGSDLGTNAQTRQCNRKHRRTEPPAVSELENEFRVG